MNSIRCRFQVMRKSKNVIHSFTGTYRTFQYIKGIETALPDIFFMFFAEVKVDSFFVAAINILLYAVHILVFLKSSGGLFFFILEFFTIEL